MPDSYKSKAEAAADRDCLDRLRVALSASHRAMRLDDCRLWTISGSRGYASTWGDRQTWMLMIRPGATARKWTSAKRRLAAFPGLALVTQDGDDEGIARLMRLPTPEEAVEIRHIAGIRQTNPSPPSGRRFSPTKTGFTAPSIAPNNPAAPEGHDDGAADE
ncbi:hypothetical protein ACVWXQ_006682 [Bradyrhizobium sp. S3.14.4]